MERLLAVLWWGEEEEEEEEAAAAEMGGIISSGIGTQYREITLDLTLQMEIHSLWANLKLVVVFKQDYFNFRWIHSV